MESVSTACAPHETAPCSNLAWSLKKLKRERKAQARSLKLHAEEQDRLQRLEIDALVEQQRLRRLKEAAQAESPSSHDNDNDLPISLCVNASKHQHKLEREPARQPENGVIWSWGGRGPTSKQHQKQSMRAAVESRRRLARGPRSGSTTADASQTAGAPMLPSEDHRVVSTDYQAAGTQALMRVTLLAAGFVIGARGISARLIGQVTGAIVQSWTESCRPDSIPIRLFRIQGKKTVVQAAVALIEQAVSKYKDLCECKRRGEFVQREHVINGVEFYYQPPPRKAFANVNNEPPQKGGDGGGGTQLNNTTSPVPSAVAYAPHHMWLQHLQQQQAQVQAATQQHNKQAQAAILEASHVANGVDGHGQTRRNLARQSHAFFDWQPQERQVMRLQSPESDHTQECATEFELIDHGLQQSVASLEQALQQVRLEQRLLQRNRTMSNNSISTNITSDTTSLHHHHNHTLNPNNTHDTSLWSDSRASQQTIAFQNLGSSLFSIFGDGGLPLPISPPDERSPDAESHSIFVDSTALCTPFDFPRCDFLRESLPTFTTWAAREAPEYSLYEASPSQEDVDDSLCIVCLDQPASVHLLPCGHDLFCFSCVGGLLTCPLCRDTIVALHPRGTSTPTPPDVSLPKLNSNSCYHLWNWVPGASV